MQCVSQHSYLSLNYSGEILEGKGSLFYLLTKHLQRLDLPASSWVLETQQESKRENCPSFKELTIRGTVKDMQIWEGFLGNLELVAREGLS